LTGLQALFPDLSQFQEIRSRTAGDYFNEMAFTHNFAWFIIPIKP